jgi:hypothetical protein
VRRGRETPDLTELAHVVTINAWIRIDVAARP